MKPYLPLLPLASAAQAATASDGCPQEFGTVIDAYNNAGSWTHVFSALERCPNIATFDLRIASGVCTPTGFFWIPFALSGSDRFVSAPSAIALEDYELGHREWSRVRPRFLTWPLLRSTAEGVLDAIWYRDWETFEWTLPYLWYESGQAREWFTAVLLPARQRLKTNLELWLDAMDFSRVRHLAFIRCTGPMDLLVEKLLSRVPRLRSLEIESNLDHNAPPHALALAVAPDTLQRLSLRNLRLPWDRIEPAVARQSQSLSFLEWRSDEIFHGQVVPVLSPTEIRRLRTIAPGLKDLTIGFQPNGTTWPWSELDALQAEAPARLANLTIYFGLKSPVLSRAAAAAMFCRLVGGSGAERPWHTVRFLSGIWRWHQNTRHRHDPAAAPEYNDFDGGRFAWAICSAWRPDGSLKAPEEALCDSRQYEIKEDSSPVSNHCFEYDLYYARLSFERRKEVERHLWGLTEDRI